MLRYSLRKLMRRAGRSSQRIILAFRAHASSQPPKNIYDPLYPYYYKDYSGDSYMLNPHELILNEFRYTPKEVAQYIALASYRSYNTYILTGHTSLDLFHSPMTEDAINNNRLLRIKDNRIHFYYEEVISRRNKIWH